MSLGAAAPFSNGTAAFVFNAKPHQPMPTSSPTPPAGTDRPISDVRSTAPDQKPPPEATTGSADASRRDDPDASSTRPPTLAEARVYWVLSRS